MSAQTDSEFYFFSRPNTIFQTLSKDSPISSFFADLGPTLAPEQLSAPIVGGKLQIVLLQRKKKRAPV